MHQVHGIYLTALVCKNGHVATYRLEAEQETKINFCTACGQEMVSTCAGCSEPIRGAHAFVQCSESWGDLHLQAHYNAIQDPQCPPLFCHKCGNSYPWTEAILIAAQNLVEEADIPNDEKEKLKRSIPDLMSDTPRSKVAVAVVKKWLDKATTTTVSAFREIIVDVASEAVKKGLGL